MRIAERPLTPLSYAKYVSPSCRSSGGGKEREAPKDQLEKIMACSRQPRSKLLRLPLPPPPPPLCSRRHQAAAPLLRSTAAN